LSAEAAGAERAEKKLVPAGRVECSEAYERMWRYHRAAWGYCLASGATEYQRGVL
jgi:hypothetical protein